jgi:hypothetical protein
VLTDYNSGASFNRYVYANNNPYRYIDPDGRETLSLGACRGFCVGIAIGKNSKGEFALTLNVGAGFGGGFSHDPRPNENGRMSPVGGDANSAGITVAAFAKVEGEVSAAGGSVAMGTKVGGGIDLTTGQKVGGKSDELGFSASDSSKVSLGATKQGGFEVSVYVNPKEALKDAGEKVVRTVMKLLKSKDDVL